MGTLFERLGGEAAIQAAVVTFYGKVLGDASLAPFFAGLDIDALIKKQIAFMSMAFAGPHTYSGRDLRVAHAPLVERGLSDQHFDAIANHLRSTLEELAVDAQSIVEILAIVNGTRADVLNRS